VQREDSQTEVFFVSVAVSAVLDPFYFLLLVLPPFNDSAAGDTGQAGTGVTQHPRRLARFEK